MKRILCDESEWISIWIANDRHVLFMVKRKSRNTHPNNKRMERITRMDSGLLVKIWYQSTEAATEIYNIIYYVTLKKTSVWIRDRTKRIIYDVRVWGCYV